MVMVLLGGKGKASSKLKWGLVDILVLVFALVPVLWVVSLSFKTKATLSDGNFIPREWTLQNYADIFQTTEFIRALVNSIGIAIIATVIAVTLGTMAAYAIARLDFPGKQILVALLFRTLDAFRIFDNIYVLTGGAQDTGSVSMQTYDNLVKGLNLGIGSTMAVLIFITVAIIAFIFIKVFGTAAPGSDDGGKR